MDSKSDASGRPAVIIEWIQTLLDNVRKLTGQRAPPQEHQRIAYLLTRFSSRVVAVQHLSLYHAGEGLVCEVDMVLPPDTSLPVAHNLGEAVQYAIEALSGIERSFVYVLVVPSLTVYDLFALTLWAGRRAGMSMSPSTR